MYRSTLVSVQMPLKCVISQFCLTFHLLRTWNAPISCNYSLTFGPTPRAKRPTFLPSLLSSNKLPYFCKPLRDST